MEAGALGLGCLFFFFAPTGLQFSGNKVESRISGLGPQLADGLWFASPCGPGTSDL